MWLRTPAHHLLSLLYVSSAIAIVLIFCGVTILHQSFIFQSRPFEAFYSTEPRMKFRMCNKTKHVLFLKTHKTGSSTITNILNRFADNNDLEVALPHEPLNRFHWPQSFQSSFINYKKLRKKNPDILCNHARYNWMTLSSTMPNDTVFITILRHPHSLFESAFSYFEYARILGIPGKTKYKQMQEFIKKPMFFMSKSLDSSVLLLQNGMAFDLGLDRENFYNKSKITQFIHHLEEKFGLVLILEHFEESLILLRRRLCWSLEDVANFRLLQRQTKYELPSDAKSFVDQFNQADILLFDHFNKTLWEKIKRQKQDFHDEVEQLKAVNIHLYKKCGCTNEITRGFWTNVMVNSIRMKATNLTITEKKKCCQMTLNEVNYLKYHNRKQTVHRNSLTRRESISMQC